MLLSPLLAVFASAPALTQSDLTTVWSSSPTEFTAGFTSGSVADVGQAGTAIGLNLTIFADSNPVAVAVPEDWVFIREGLYRPTSSVDIDATILIPEGVSLFGGFVGGEASLDERPPAGSAPTVVSGDVLGDDAPGQLQDNCRHVLSVEPGTQAVRIESLVVRGGFARYVDPSGGPYNSMAGAGLLIPIGSVARVKECVFTENEAEVFGGGVYVRDSEAKFEDCLFIANTSNDGAALFALDSKIELICCDILENDSGWSVAGVSIRSPSQGTEVLDCRFIENRLVNTLSSGGAGALRVRDGLGVRVERCEFRDNLSTRGAGIEFWDGISHSVVDCLFVGNEIRGITGGSGIAVLSGGEISVVNCTFVDNRTQHPDLEAISDSATTSNVSVVNSIFWGNVDSTGIASSSSQIDPDISVTRSIVQFGFPGQFNSAIDPQFVELAGGDLRLTAGSPAVDASDNTLRPDSASATDLDGNPRLFEQYGSPNSGFGAPIADLGAYERVANELTEHVGCFGNEDRVVPLSAPFQVGSPLLLGYEESDPQHAEPGVALFYAGRDGTSAAGCGIELPGIGELLLSLATPVYPLVSVSTGAGFPTAAAPIPDNAALVGQTFGIQALNLVPQQGGTLPPEGELSSMLVGTLVP